MFNKISPIKTSSFDTNFKTPSVKFKRDKSLNQDTFVKQVSFTGEDNSNPNKAFVKEIKNKQCNSEKLKEYINHPSFDPLRKFVQNHRATDCISSYTEVVNPYKGTIKAYPIVAIIGSDSIPNKEKDELFSALINHPKFKTDKAMNILNAYRNDYGHPYPKEAFARFDLDKNDYKRFLPGVMPKSLMTTSISIKHGIYFHNLDRENYLVNCLKNKDFDPNMTLSNFHTKGKEIPLYEYTSQKGWKAATEKILDHPELTLSNEQKTEIKTICENIANKTTSLIKKIK